MASISFRAVPGVSLLIQNNGSGMDFRVEKSGESDAAGAPDIMLTSGPDGVRLSVLHNPHPRPHATHQEMTSAAMSPKLPAWQSWEHGYVGNSASWASGSGVPTDRADAAGPVFGQTSSMASQSIDGFLDTLDYRSFSSSSSSPVVPSNKHEWSNNWTRPYYTSDEDSSEYSPQALDFSDTSSTFAVSPGFMSGTDSSHGSPEPTVSRSSLACTMGCDQTFPDKERRKKHEEMCHPRAPLYCSEPGCHTSFSRPHDRRRHEVRRHGHASHSCGKCGKFFTSERGLQRHNCPKDRTNKKA